MSAVHRLRPLRKQQQQRRFLQSSTVAASLLLVCSFVGFWISYQQSCQPHAGVTCSEVFANDVKYLRHELDPDLQQRIKAHIDACRPCRNHIHAKESQLKTAAFTIRASAHKDSLASVK